MTAKTWDGTTNDWYKDDGADWGPAGDPAADDQVIINTGEAYPNSGDAGFTVASITLSNSGILAIADPGVTQSVTGAFANSTIEGESGANSTLTGLRENDGSFALGYGASTVTKVSWKNPVSGDWSTASDWSTGKVPGASNDVTIGATGAYTVTISMPEAAHSLTVSASGATVSDTSTFSLGTTLTLTAGEFALASGGEVVGGTINVGSAGDFVGAGGTLDGVKFEGTLDLTPANSVLTITGGTTFAGAGGSGAATINFSSNYNQNSILYVEGTATLDNATVNIGGPYAPPYSGYITATDYIVNDDTTGSGAILTLGSKLVIDQSGASVAITSSNYAGDGIVNDGTIDAGFSGGSFGINAGSPNNFINNGAIDLSNGDSMDIVTPKPSVRRRGLG